MQLWLIIHTQFLHVRIYHEFLFLFLFCTQPKIEFALKRATHAQACDVLQMEYNSMSEIRRRIKSPLMINVISAFHKIQNVSTEDVHHCMFLQEQIAFALPLRIYAEQISKTQSPTTKNTLLQGLISCYNDRVKFNDKLHSIGYIHGDIDWLNIFQGIKLTVKITVETNNNHKLYNTLSNSSSEETNMYMPKTYRYEIVDKNMEKKHCYMIDFSSTRSRQRLLNMKIDPLKIASPQLLITQTFIFSHPYLYKAIAYPQGRMLLSQYLTNQLDANMTQTDIDNVIWDIIISCERYTNAATFLSVLPKINIIDGLDAYGAGLHGIIGRYDNILQRMPRFENYARRNLVSSQKSLREWSLRAVKAVLLFLEKNKDSVINKKSKSLLEPMLDSMYESLIWYPTTYEFELDQHMQAIFVKMN